MTDSWCELCAAKGLKKKLKYCQVNFKEGISVCENEECVYPFSAVGIDSLLVKTEHSSSLCADKPRSKRSQGSESKATAKKGCPSFGVPPQFHWSNRDSLCWLDSVMTLLVHNRCLQLCLEKLQPKGSVLQNLYSKFFEAQRRGPVKEGNAILEQVRMEVFQFLKNKMKCELGVNDSAITSLILLLKENKLISEKFTMEYQWNFRCMSCGYVQTNRFKKWIVSFPNTAEDFTMPAGVFLRPCFKCQSPRQRSTLQFQQMPPCVVAHFVEGVKNEDFLKSRFVCQGREYELFQVIQYKRNPDHFVPWVRNANGTHWAEVDDAKDVVCKWRQGIPSIPVHEIHIAVWESTRLYQKNVVSGEKNNDLAMHREKSSASAGKVDCFRCEQFTSAAVKSNRSKPPGLLESNDSSSLLMSSKGPTSLSPSVVSSSSFGGVVRSGGNSGLKLGCETRVENTNHEEDKVARNKRKTENFEPYIPRKKRNRVEEGTIVDKIERVAPQDDSRSVTENTGEQLGKTVVPQYKSPASFGDNQSDSGYSSPASNSSCVSQPVACGKDKSSLSEFLDSFESLDFPDLVDFPRCAVEAKKEDGKIEATSGNSAYLDEILGEIFSGEEFPEEKSPTMSVFNDSKFISSASDLPFEQHDTDDISWLDCVANSQDFLLDV